MLTLPILTAILLQSPAQDATAYRVVDVEHTSAFAGKLGRRMMEILTLERAGMTYTLELGPFHSRFGRAPEYQAGEMLRIDGVVKGSTITTTWDRVKRA